MIKTKDGTMKFTDTHEWVQIEGAVATVGVTRFAQKELGDIVYVELPTVGKVVKAGQECAVLESTKAAADVYSPVTGTLTAVNESLRELPEQVNSDAEGHGWLFKIAMSDPAELDELMDRNTYEKRVH